MREINHLVSLFYCEGLAPSEVFAISCLVVWQKSLFCKKASPCFSKISAYISSLALLPMKSKLPQQSSIFATMTQMAIAHGAVNLAQGFPNFEVDAELTRLVGEGMRQGHNQYAPYAGLLSLREQIARKCQLMYGVSIDPAREICISTGASEALFCAITALVFPGQEAIVLDPAFDTYKPAVVLSGGKVVPVPLSFPSYEIDWEALEASITPRTRLIIVNTPHNPTGTRLPAQAWERLYQAVKGKDIFVISDEVYEHQVFDGKPHNSMLQHEGLMQQGCCIFSFGKIFHITGWKVGYCIGKEDFIKEFQKIHQQTVFSTATPFQWALAQYMEDESRYTHLYARYERQRNLFLELMAPTPFEPIPCEGTYFQLMRYGHFSSMPDQEFAHYLIKEAGVAAIPVSVFYSSGEDRNVLRFCFAKEDETLITAAERLGQYFQKQKISC